ncbi:TPA: methionine--tRNA ligase [archaeon]|uniref:Methionine--tRNA ligase n=1 Tax=Candidatus Naiadarchaeum limnaeum TaxID=2756139 RepID=A0A832XI22_9ARCH|nr:methionine--tRNA ligase [Candidatus Naiadarchaeales archaeon SRR2090153.bin1042]HIK00171.1 methionine--tRNA ligase [Candidatus Naiadarchaeum limnaeum]
MEKISFEEFKKVNLLVGQIKEAEKISGKDKLYKLKIDIGRGALVQLIAGIAPYYSIEELINKKIILVENLQPAKIGGEVSNGMLLAADDKKGKVVLLTVDRDVEVGAEAR